MKITAAASPQVKVDHVPHSMGHNTEIHFNKTMTDKLLSTMVFDKYPGVWHVYNFKTLRSVDLPDHLVFKQLVPGRPRAGIKFHYKHHNRESTFEGILEPPRQFRDMESLVSILHMLMPERTEQEHEAAYPDQIVTGRVVTIAKDGVYVNIFPGNPPDKQKGFIPVDELDHRIGVDPSQIIRTGELVTCKVMSVDFGKVIMSRRVMLESADKFGGVNNEGQMRWAGYFDDPGRVAYIKKICQDAAKKFGRREGDTYIVNAKKLQGELRDEIIRRYGAKEVNLAPCLRFLANSGWLARDVNDNNHSEKYQVPVGGDTTVAEPPKAESKLKGGLNSGGKLLIDPAILAPPKPIDIDDLVLPEVAAMPPLPTPKVLPPVKQELPEPKSQADQWSTPAPSPAIDLDAIIPILPLVEEYDKRKSELEQIRKQAKELAEMLELAEADMQAWIELHPTIVEESEKFKKIEQFFLARNRQKGE